MNPFSLASMARRPISALVTLGLSLVVATLTTLPAAGQNAPTPYRAPRLKGTTHPDLNGLWQSLNEGNWDIQAHPAQPGPPEYGALYAEPGGPGIVEGNEIPYQSWALAKKKENLEKRFVREVRDGIRFEPLDPESKCYMPGVPRANYMPFPFQIVQGTNAITIAYEFAAATRIVHMDKAEQPPADTYMGWSVGRWEGDTLVIDVTGFNENTWFDRSGNFHSDALHVVERYTPANSEVIRYEATIEDPKVFTRQWKISFPLYRRLEKNAQFMEFKCVPFSEELLYGHLRKQPDNR